MIQEDIHQIIDALALQPHPEGGYYKETYRSKGSISKLALDGAYTGDRDYATGIYFLITQGNFSAFHRIIQDEMWHFYKGDPMSLHIIHPDGSYELIAIGNDLESGQVPQYVVPGGSWFASEVANDGRYSLMGCTVAPGFDFEDFEMPSREELTQRFPQHANLITKLTHDADQN